jgi:cephalosporin hydroxylase
MFMNLWQDFLNNKGKVIHKWVHYFPIYERHFNYWQNKSMTFLEIGVSKGGSLQMWQRYFGPLAKIVGIDINPDSKQHESAGIYVRIGDQSEPKFLQSIIDEFGIPDVILDDGSHQMNHIIKTFDYFYPRMSKNGIYMVEDLHTAYWGEYGGGIEKPDTFINISKQLVDKLNADHTRGKIAPDEFTKNTFSICFYDSIVVFEKGQVFRKEAPQIGDESK